MRTGDSFTTINDRTVPRVIKRRPRHGWKCLKSVIVTRCGRICLKRKKVNFSVVFAGQKVGIKEVGDGIWSVAFMDYDLGFFDLDSCRVEPGKNPFRCRVLNLSPEHT